MIHDLTQPPSGSNLKEAKLDVLARPYPRAVAGTPRLFAFDRDSGAFELAYSTRAPDGQVAAAGSETEVLLPERHYPRVYAVGASGAEVVSGPGERVLRLVTVPGQQSVAVRVERA